MERVIAVRLSMGSMSLRASKILVLLGLLFVSLTCTVNSGRVPLCPRESVTDCILGFRNSYCPLYDDESTHNSRFASVTEGNELWLQMALDMIHKNKSDFVALLFYASWCPFSWSFRPSFDVISSLYSTVPHFVIEESSVRPSILSKYGVHGFPTLFLLNSTMQVRYRGPRTLGSLVAFYGDVTGIDTASLDKTSLDRIGQLPRPEKNSMEHEVCPFMWARSPEHLLRQETYLALATIFVLSRLLYLFFPTLFRFTRLICSRLFQNVRLDSLLEHPLTCLKRVGLMSSSLRQPRKRKNLQEGAINARAWASKSLATVSIGDSSSSRAAAPCQ